MNHEHWDEERIEELLKKVPKIHDARSKEEVFERLKQDGVFDEVPPNKVIKKKSKYIPWIIAACAALFLAILIPTFMSRSISEEAKITNDVKNEKMEKFNHLEEGQEDSVNIMMTEVDMKTAVYPEQLDGKTLFKIGLASDDADSIPVTILIPNEKILEDFGKANPTPVEMYNLYAPRLNENLLGFVDYHPYDGKIIESNGKVVHQLPEDHPYDASEATLSTYYATLMDTFSDYQEIEFVDEQNQPKEMGKESSLLISDERTQHSYFKYVQQDGAAFLAPNYRETFSTVEEAMEALKRSTNEVYQSVVLPNVDYTIKVEQNIVKIAFKEPLDLFNYNQVEAMQMIEGMLLTAAGFNMAVQFENIVQAEWEGFDFTKPLPIPLGPNQLPYTVLENE